ncbi:MAG TPA: hypothetical protein VFG03_05260 [Telluria sp.]|nr:hypothetical protein [Telluria sp.]
MSDVEREVLKMFDGSKAVDEDLFETSNVNQLAWTLAAVFGGLVIWLSIALVNAENQRYALMTNKCPDQVFKGEIDKRCLVLVHSREHWWQHWWYAMTNVTPPNPGK